MTPGAGRSRVVAFGVLEEWGGLFSTLRVAREFRSRGYRVLYLVRPPQRFHTDRSDIRHPDRLKAYIQDAGFAVETVPMPRLPASKLARAESYRHWFTELLELSKRLLRGSAVELLLLQPPLSFPFALPAVQLGIPALLLNPHFGDFLDRRVPPINSSRLPPTGAVSTALNLLDWSWKLLAYQARRHARPIVLLSHFLGVQRTVRQLLRSHDLKLRFTGNRLYLDLPMMKIGPRELDFSPGPAHVYLGANVDLQRPEPALSWDAVEPSQKVIYCTLGEYGDRMPGGARFLQSVLEVARDRPDLHFVIPAGNVALEELGRVPANVTHPRWVPQLETLRRSSLAITSGGFGTIKECIAMGVPMIAVPFIHDQPGNAARLAYHGLGAKADPRRLCRATLERLLDQVLGSEEIRARVDAMKPHLLTEEPLQRGVDLLEEVVRDPSRAELLTWTARTGA